MVVPSSVQILQECFWSDGQIKQQQLPTITEIRQYVRDSLQQLREDHKRLLNPTPYKVFNNIYALSTTIFKVSVSNGLYEFLHDLWLQHAPIGRLQ